MPIDDDRAKNDRGQLCKTSIPGSNPGGASNFFLTKTRVLTRSRAAVSVKSGLIQGKARTCYDGALLS